jgi:hypothetical protein
MSHSARPVLYHPQIVAAFRNALAQARAKLDEMELRHLTDLAELQSQHAELREIVLMVISILRQQAETDVTKLRLQLETVLARLERDPARPLH